MVLSPLPALLLEPGRSCRRHRFSFEVVPSGPARRRAGGLGARQLSRPMHTRRFAPCLACAIDTTT